ncbi:MAG: FAD binding domain-containing protein [Actinobacteria bacterium]|nr:FAD binding domain-containing protein [Actinomycetota bacterium]MCL5447413.1 FAD binding domain-containing protein [Actinomycetota bacterium]
MATMSGVARPVSVEGALNALDEDPAAQVLAGGTGFMVKADYVHRMPQPIAALSRVVGAASSGCAPSRSPSIAIYL